MRDRSLTGLPPEEGRETHAPVTADGDGGAAPAQPDPSGLRAAARVQSPNPVFRHGGPVGAVQIDTRVPGTADLVAGDADPPHPEGGSAVVLPEPVIGVGAAVGQHPPGLPEPGEGGDLDEVVRDGDSGVLVLDLSLIHI